MKRCTLFNILFLLICGMQTSLYAQAPLAIPYQAVARDNTGNPLVNQAIALRFTLHNANATGTIIYQETQNVTTNSLGLFSINFGTGTPLIGTMTAVLWQNGAKYLQVELDPNGGTNYTNMGTTQLMSVPYALFAANGRNTPNGNSGGNTMRWNGTTWIADNSMYNDGNNIGIGTLNPESKLHIAKTGDAELYIESIGAKKYSLQSSDTAIGIKTTFQIIDRNLGVARLGIDNNGNVGIGTTTPAEKLDVNGTTKTTNLQISNGAANGYFLKSDSNGNASWGPPGLIETDPKVGTLNNNIIPKWNGTTLADGLLFDNGTNLGINTTTPTNKLSVYGNTDITGKLGINTSTPEGELQIKTVNIANSVIDQQQLDYDLTVSGLVYWQSFTAGVTGFLTAVDLGATSPTYPSSSPGTIKIYNGEGNSGALLATTSGTFIPVLHSFQSFPLQTPIPVTAGNIYTIELSVPNCTFGFIHTQTNNPYSGGRSSYSALSGSYDFAFKTYVSTQLEDALVVKDAKVGIGTTAPSQTLDVVGTTKTSSLQITNGASNGFVLKSDENGNASWVNANTLSIAETDPKIGILTSNKIPKWNGTTLADGLLFDNGTNVGIGTSTPAQKLEVNGTTKTTNLQITNGAANGFVLKSDANGNASWVNANTLSVAETDPKIGILTSNKIPKWNGTTLADGLLFDNGTNVGIGTSTPAQKLEVNGTTKTSNLQITNGAANGFVLKSDANGNASWANANTLNITETDPKVGSLTSNKIPRWNGTTLSDGLVFDNGTNVGIGTSTPTQTLDINGRLRVASGVIQNGTTPVTASSDLGLYSQVANSWMRFVTNNGKMQFFTENGGGGIGTTPKMQLDETGNLGIGTTAPSTTLDVNGGIKTKYSGTAVLNVTAGITTPYQIVISSLPTGWDYTNTVVLLSAADGVAGNVQKVKLTGLTNIDVYFDASQSGSVRFNWIIFKM